MATNQLISQSFYFSPELDDQLEGVKRVDKQKRLSDKPNHEWRVPTVFSSHGAQSCNYTYT